jgi:hypothetical protein
MTTFNTLRQLFIGLRQGFGLTFAERQDFTARALSLGSASIHR